MPETATLLDPAPWVMLLPESIDDVDPTYADDVRGEARATVRHKEIQRIVSETQANVAAGASDPSVDPQTLKSASAELAGARALASVLAPIPVVPQTRHMNIARLLPAKNLAVYRLPRPPAVLGEMVHWMRLHSQAGELPPVASKLDLASIKQYEIVAEQAARLWHSQESLADGPVGTMESYIRAYDAVINNPEWDELLTAIEGLTKSIDKANAARPDSGSCNYGSHSRMRLQAAQPQERWTYVDAVRSGILVMAQ